jgi:hypothetical protein
MPLAAGLAPYRALLGPGETLHYLLPPDPLSDL